MARKKERLTRTTITIPASMKEAMSRTGTNWSEEIREMIAQRLEENEGGRGDMARAVIINERVKRRAPAGWKSIEEIKKWRKSGRS